MGSLGEALSRYDLMQELKTHVSGLAKAQAVLRGYVHTLQKERDISQTFSWGHNVFVGNSCK